MVSHRPKSEPDAIEARRTIVADLLVNGWTAPKIARHLNVHHSTIYDDIAAVRALWRENQTHSYDEWVTAELESLATYDQNLAHRISAGDPVSIGVGLRVKERRAKYAALDAPTRVIVDDSRIQGLLEVAQKLGIADLPEVKEILAIESE